MSFAQLAARVALAVMALAVSALTFLGAQPPVPVHGAPPLHPTPRAAVLGSDPDRVTEMAGRAALGLPRLTPY